MRSIVIILVAAALSPALGLVSAYHVEPVKAAWSGWTPLYGNVSEVITCNFDELDSMTGAYVELFAGEYGNGGDYNLSIWTYPGGTQIAYKLHGKYVRPQHWVRFDSINVTYPESIVKGKQLEFRFTRTGNDSIRYYYAENAYDYGHIVIGGGQLQQPPGSAPDLCMRVFGRMNSIDSTWLSVQVHLFTAGLDAALEQAHAIGIRCIGDDLGTWDA